MSTYEIPIIINPDQDIDQLARTFVEHPILSNLAELNRALVDDSLEHIGGSLVHYAPRSLVAIEDLRNNLTTALRETCAQFIVHIADTSRFAYILPNHPHYQQASTTNPADIAYRYLPSVLEAAGYQEDLADFNKTAQLETSDTCVDKILTEITFIDVLEITSSILERQGSPSFCPVFINDLKHSIVQTNGEVALAICNYLHEPYDYLGSAEEIVSGFNLGQFATTDFDEEKIQFFTSQAQRHKLLGIELATKVANLTFLGMQALQDVAKQNGWHRSNGAEKHNYRDHDSTILVTAMKTINQLINRDQEFLMKMQEKTPALLTQIQTVDSPSFLTGIAQHKDELHEFGLADKLNYYVKLGVIRAAFELWKDVVVLRQAKERCAKRETAHKHILASL